jgi:alpha-L-fucosidase
VRKYATDARIEVNGDAIYGTHNWIKFSEGGGRGENTPDVRYTVKNDTLFAIVLGGNWSGGQITLSSLGASGQVQGKISSVTMLGSPGRLVFTRAADGLETTLPTPDTPPLYAYVLTIAGLKMNASTATESGNPQ